MTGVHINVLFGIEVFLYVATYPIFAFCLWIFSNTYRRPYFSHRGGLRILIVAHLSDIPLAFIMPLVQALQAKYHIFGEDLNPVILLSITGVLLCAILIVISLRLSYHNYKIQQSKACLQWKLHLNPNYVANHQNTNIAKILFCFPNYITRLIVISSIIFVCTACTNFLIAFRTANDSHERSVENYSIFLSCMMLAFIVCMIYWMRYILNFADFWMVQQECILYCIIGMLFIIVLPFIIFGVYREHKNSVQKDSKILLWLSIIISLMMISYWIISILFVYYFNERQMKKITTNGISNTDGTETEMFSSQRIDFNGNEIEFRSDDTFVGVEVQEEEEDEEFVELGVQVEESKDDEQNSHFSVDDVRKHRAILRKFASNKGYETFMHSFVQELNTEILLFVTVFMQIQNFLIEHNFIDADKTPQMLYLGERYFKLAKSIPTPPIIIQKQSNEAIKRGNKDVNQLIPIFVMMYDQFIKSNFAPLEINIRSDLRKKIYQHFQHMNIHKSIEDFTELWMDFLQVGQEMYSMVLDTFNRYDPSLYAQTSFWKRHGSILKRDQKWNF